MVHEWFELFGRGKAAEFAAAAVTASYGRNPSIKQPINKGKNRKAQAECPRDKNNTNGHDETPKGLVKIFRDVKLAAAAAWAAFKNNLITVKLSPRVRAMRAFQLFPRLGFKHLITFTLRAMTGDGFHHKGS